MVALHLRQGRHKTYPYSQKSYLYSATPTKTAKPLKEKRVYQPAQGQVRGQQEREKGDSHASQPTPSKRQSIITRMLLFCVAAIVTAFRSEPAQSQPQMQQAWEEGDNQPMPQRKQSVVVNVVIFLLLAGLGVISTFWSEPFLNFVQDSPQLSFLHPKPTPPRLTYSTNLPPSLRPLQRAARQGDLQQVNNLIKSGADVKGEEGRAAFFQAALFDHTSVMQVLLQKGVNPNAEDSLRRVVRANKAIAVQLLLKAGANPNFKEDPRSDSILFEALLGNPYIGFLSWDYRLDRFPIIGESRVEVVKALIEGGADPKDRDRSNGTNVLMLAAGQGHTDLVKLLIQKGANVNSPNAYGDTPLMYAARRGAIAVVKVLLENKAKVNAPDPNPYHRHTPLMYAVKSGSIESVKLLLAKGANVNAFTNERDLASGKIRYFKSTVLDHALQIGEPNITVLLKNSGAKFYLQLPQT